MVCDGTSFGSAGSASALYLEITQMTVVALTVTSKKNQFGSKYCFNQVVFTTFLARGAPNNLTSVCDTSLTYVQEILLNQNETEMVIKLFVVYLVK